MKIISIISAIILTLFNYNPDSNNQFKTPQKQNGYAYQSYYYEEIPLPTTESGYVILETNEYGDICIDYNGEPTWVTPMPDCDCCASVDWDEFDDMLNALDGEFIPNENDNSELT